MEYATVVQRAYAIERDHNEWRATQAAKKGANSNQGSSNNKKRKWTTNQGKKIEDSLPCNQCGRKHGGLCLEGKNVCYKCGQEGHKKQDCPSKQVALPTLGDLFQVLIERTHS